MLMPEKVRKPLALYRTPRCFELTGKSFLLKMDDSRFITLTFDTNDELTYAPRGEEPKRLPYECLLSQEQLYFVNFEELGAKPRTCRTYVIDTREMLVTEAKAIITYSETDENECGYLWMPSIRFTFGAIRRDDGTYNDIRHGYTADMVGKAINWNYGTFEIVHVYSSERYYRVAFMPRTLERQYPSRPAPQPGVHRPVYEDYADYIKIRDGVYMVSLLETVLCRRNGHGASLLFLMDLNVMHDVGRAFAMGGDPLEEENYSLGAYGEYFDASETLAKPSETFIR